MSDGACDGESGNWRQLTCPNESPKKLDHATATGCDDPVDIVPDQPPPGDPGLRSRLLDGCPPGKGDGDTDCLPGDTGSDFASNGVIGAWGELLGQRIKLPVVCGVPTCTPRASRYTGSNAQYPLHRIVDITVCGYHWKENKKADINPGGCAGSPAVDSDTTQDQYLVLVFDEATPGGPGAGGSSALVR